MLNMDIGRSLGWLRDYMDVRDYSPEHPMVQPLIRKLNLLGSTDGSAALPAVVDLRPSCTAIHDQGRLGACSAHAAVGLVEFCEKRAAAKYTPASRLFVYKATRQLMGVTGDTGAYMRTTLGALVLFGAPPEKYWPYDAGRFDVEPSAFCYSLGANYQALKYLRLDLGVTPAELLNRIKTYLAANLPSMFGFSVYTSIGQADVSGRIPFPSDKDVLTGGHALLAVGYDDGAKIRNAASGSAESTGALLVRNSWGSKWGEAGYGWLPYEYVLRKLATDWWTITASQWVDTEQFGI